MAKRTNDLTEIAQPIANDLAARCGSLKRVLSAGVLALNALTPEQREVFMAQAAQPLGTGPGKESPQTLLSAIKRIVETTKAKQETPPMIIHISPHDKEAWDALEAIAKEQRGAETPKKKKQSG